MSPLLIRLALIVLVSGGLYGAGYLRATMRFYTAHDLAVARSERDQARADTETLQKAAADTAERTTKIEAVNAGLQAKVRDYESKLANPRPSPACPAAVAACRLGGDDARRLRDLGTGRSTR